MPSDARGIPQHAGAEIAARGDAGAADCAPKHRKHLVKSCEALGRTGQLVIELQIIGLGRNTHLLERQVDAAQKLYGAMGVARSDAVGRKMAYIRNHAFFDAPHAVLVFMPEPFDTREAADIGMYAQTLMLALTARGIASCAQGALGLFPEIIREQLGIPQNYKLLFGVSFGYEDRNVKANAARVGRAPLDGAVRFHR